MYDSISDLRHPALQPLLPPVTINIPNPQAQNVAVVLVNWNNWRDTVECIDSLLAQDHRNLHIFVVDNGSSDGSVERIQEWCAKPRAYPGWREFPSVLRHTAQPNPAPAICRVADQPAQALPQAPVGCRISLIHSGGNLGFAGGCNVGIRAAGTQAFGFFWMLNNDTVVERGALDAMLRRALRDAGTGMVGSTVRYYDAPQEVQTLGGARLDAVHGISRHIGQGVAVDHLNADPVAVERKMDYVFGASLLVSSAFVREIGPMQEDYFLYFEEIDWALRGRGRFSLGYAPDSHVFHKSGASATKNRPLFTSGFYYRNRIRFMSRFFPDRLPATRRRLAAEILFYLAKRQWAHARLVASVVWNAHDIARQTPQNASDPSRATPA
ncbi:MAG: glycosyltransferase family 2 protein [Nevskia sp.]|nr:glycosyltransferase family 2 protein [Nevskia sp.]